jgi:signal transduction histidine kinase
LRAASALLVALAYYAGGQIDRLLGWTSSPAVLWPPNAVLLAALLLSPRRTWWVYLLAVLPADRAISWPLPLVPGLCIYASNTAQSLLAAWLIRMANTGARPRWDHYSFVLRFVFLGAIVAPCAAAVLGGATLWAFRGVPFSVAWRGWAVANVLTLLTVAPFLAVLGNRLATNITAAAPLRRLLRVRRPIEAALLFGVMAAVTAFVFGLRWTSFEGRWPLLYAPLPLLLWAALRLGPGHMSAALFVLTLIAIYGTAHGGGPFPPGVAATRMLELQFLLVSMALPLLVLTAALESELTERQALATAQEEMRRTKDQLAVVARTAAMGEISAAVVHEISQPLTAILSNAQAAEQLLAAEPPEIPEVREALNDIAADVRRAVDTSLRLRGLLKHGDAERTSQDLNAIVQQVARLVAGEANARQVAVTLELEPKLRGVFADRTQVQQVLLNLLMNGLEAVRDVARSVKPALLVRTRNTDDSAVEVSVQDNGPGIALARLPRIFEPFYTTKSEGLGLGLSICRSIVRAHGGTLEAVNNADRGATFRFTIPAATTQP